jgi:uncharacterized membrane protein
MYLQLAHAAESGADVVSALGKMHLQIVHFPIALAVLALVADLLWMLARRGRFAPAFKASGTFLLVAAAIMAIPTVIAGDNLMDSMAKYFTGDLQPVGNWHVNLGITTMSILILAAVLRLAFINRQTKWWPVAHGVLILGAAGLAALTAHLGGTLAWPTLFSAPFFIK